MSAPRWQAVEKLAEAPQVVALSCPTMPTEIQAKHAVSRMPEVPDKLQAAEKLVEVPQVRSMRTLPMSHSLAQQAYDTQCYLELIGRGFTNEQIVAKARKFELCV